MAWASELPVRVDGHVPWWQSRPRGPTAREQFSPFNTAQIQTEVTDELGSNLKLLTEPQPPAKKKKKGKGHRHPKVMDYLDQHLWQGSIHLTLTQEIYARQIFDQNVWSSYLRIIYKKWIQINSLQWKQPFSSKKEKKKESQWYKPYSTQTSIKTYSHGTRNQRGLCLL